MTGAKRRYGRSRRDLAEAAIAQIEEKGFAATTIEDVAEAAGYSPRTFFRQFGSKEDVVLFDLPDILSPLEKLLTDPPSDAWAAVTGILLENCATWEAAGKPLAQTRTRLIHEEPALHRRYLEVSAEWESVIARIFAKERKEKRVGVESQVIASSIVGAARVAMRRWIDQPRTSLGDHLAAGLAVVRLGAENVME